MQCRRYDSPMTQGEASVSPQRSSTPPARRMQSNPTAAPSTSSAQAGCSNASRKCSSTSLSDSDSPGGSSNDAASDLEDFIDFAPEHNSYGLVRRVTSRKEEASDGCGVTPSHSAGARGLKKEHVQAFCESQLIPDWQAHCSDLLKEYSIGAGSTRRRKLDSSTHVADDLLCKRARRSPDCG